MISDWSLGTVMISDCSLVTLSYVSSTPTLSTSLTCSYDACWTAMSNSGQSLTSAEKLARFAIRLSLDTRMLMLDTKMSSNKITNLEALSQL